MVLVGSGALEQWTVKHVERSRPSRGGGIAHRLSKTLRSGEAGINCEEVNLSRLEVVTDLPFLLVHCANGRKARLTSDRAGSSFPKSGPARVFRVMTMQGSCSGIGQWGFLCALRKPTKVRRSMLIPCIRPSSHATLPKWSTANLFRVRDGPPRERAITPALRRQPTIPPF